MRVALYARVSTEKQEKQETVKSQLQSLRDYARKNNYTVYEEYIDEGYSGELLDRPELDRLRDDAKKKLFDTVLVHSPDRLSRKYIYLGLLQEELKKNGVVVVFLNRPDSKDTPEDNLFNGVQGLIAEYEKAKILERTRRGKLHKAKSNILIGSIPPYGYRYIKKTDNVNGRYEIIDKESMVIRLIFKLFLNKGLSIRAVAKELTRKGIQPRRGKHWRTSSLHKIIRNETYTGVTYYNKNISVETDNNGKYRRVKNTGRRLRPKDQWIQITLPKDLKIIDQKTFNAAQRQLKKNSELSPRNTKNQYLLRGLIKCGKCDSPFYGTPCHNELFYRCGNRDRAFPEPRKCSVGMVKAENIESVVWDTFCEAIKNPKLISKQIPKLKDKALKGKADTKKNVESIEKRIKETENESDRLLDAYREKIITMDQLKDQMVKIQDKQRQLELDKQALVTEQESSISPMLTVKSIEYFCKHVEKRLNSLRNDFEAKRYLLSLAITKIILEGKTVRIRGIIPQELPAFSNTASW
jgi:site-specific DNA recombinase